MIIVKIGNEGGEEEEEENDERERDSHAHIHSYALYVSNFETFICVFFSFFLVPYKIRYKIEK